MNPLLEFDLSQNAGGPLCGVDEAGRGPLCGPVTVAAVILNPERPVEGLNDSKKLSEKKREALYGPITETALGYTVVHIPPQVIDEINIHQAVLLGMKQAVEGLPIAPALVLVDGLYAPQYGVPCRCVTKGDAKSASIAAASILAKVSRDRLMQQLAEEYPQYRLEQHKGYGTKLHYEMLNEYGPSPIHRVSFLKKWQAGR